MEGEGKAIWCELWGILENQITKPNPTKRLGLLG